MALFGPTLPGETPIDDVSGLKVKGITKRAELNIHEAKNIVLAAVKYLSKKPSRRSARFDYSWCLRLHREMFGKVWKWAGTLRTGNLNIGVPWSQIETRLYGLMGDLPLWGQGGMDLLEQAAMLHHKAVLIHPFPNGNGRWSRMLANIWLKLHGINPTRWPEDVIGAESTIRQDYLKAIRQADKGDYSPLIALHKQYTPAN